MEDVKSRIERLGESNYQIWKIKIELLLIKEDLWDVVYKEIPATKTAEWLKSDGKARAVIGLLVDDNQLLVIKNLTTARDYWLTLKKIHEKTSLCNKVFLLKRLCRMQLGDKSMAIHIGYIFYFMSTIC